MYTSALVSIALASAILVNGAAIEKRSAAFDALYLSQAQKSVGTLPSGWSAKGCFTDSMFSRTLSSDSTDATGMTYETCTSYCSKKGYAYAGLEWGFQCFCGNSIKSSANLMDFAFCGSTCDGNRKQSCGGWSTINVLYKAPVVQPPPVVRPPPAPPAAASSSTQAPAPAAESSVAPRAAASSDAASSPAAPSVAPSAAASSIVASPSTSVSSTSASSSSDSPSSSVAAPSPSASTSAEPSAAASSSASSTSAVASSTSSAAPAPSIAPAVVFPDGWASSNLCIAEVGGRALAGKNYAAADMTQDKCATFCASNGYTIAGIEYASECWCGNVLSNGASIVKTSTACTMKCAGDPTSICGGGNALTLIVSDAARRILSSDLASKIVALPAGWAAASTTCVAEGTSGRALASASWASDRMTVGTCLNFCQSKGFQYAGIEYGRECYCGDSLVNGASLNLPSTGCTSTCAGDDAALCGGGNALQLYNNPGLALDLITSNAFHYQGCVGEVSGRALQGDSLFSDEMTVEVCTAFCGLKGFKYAGLEYGRECYCGNEFSDGASSLLPSTQCNFGCPASPSKNCGGPNAIALYATMSVAIPTLSVL